MKKTIYYVLCLILTIFSIENIIYASEQYNETINLEQMHKNDCDKTIINIVNAIVNNDTQYIYDNSEMFETNCLYKLDETIRNYKVEGNKLSNIVIDFTYPENSSTGDSVIMVNTLIWKADKSYNLAYLFEFHINKDGKIYGYNIWVY